MSNYYLLSDEQRDKLLEGICDQCKNCYRGLSQEEFEKVCSECVPVKIICGLKPSNRIVGKCDVTVGDLMYFFRLHMRVQIFDFSLIDEESDDWYETKDHIVYFGDYSEIPAHLFSRKIRCVSVSDEYVNCLDIELNYGK